MNPIQTFLAAKGRFELAAHRLRNDHRPLIDSESSRRPHLLLLQRGLSVDIVLQGHELQTLSNQIAGTQPSPNPQENDKWRSALGLMGEVKKSLEEFRQAAELMFRAIAKRNKSPSQEITEPSVLELRAAMRTLCHSTATLDKDLKRAEGPAIATASQASRSAVPNAAASGRGQPGTLSPIVDFLAAIGRFEDAIGEYETQHRALLQLERNAFLIRRRSIDLIRWKGQLRNRCDPSLIVQQSQNPNESPMKKRMRELMAEILNICSIDRDKAASVLADWARKKHESQIVTDPSVKTMRAEVSTLRRLMSEFSRNSEMGPPLKRNKYQ